MADDAAIATRAWDVLGGHLPLVGQYTLASSDPRQPIYDLGPLFYWLLAVPVHLDPRSGPLWGAALVAAAGSVLAVVAAAAAFGRRGAVAVAFALGALIWQVPAVLLDPAWNPHAGVVWLLTTIACASAVAAGRLRWWPALVFSASLTAQLNLEYVAPALAAFVFAAVAAPLLARRQRAGWRWLLAGAGVGAALWTPTLVQEATGQPGNLSLLFSTFGRASGSHLPFGVRALSAVVDPHVLHFSSVRGSTVVEPLARVAGESVVPGLVLAAAVAAVLALAVATKRWGLATATGMAAAVCASVVATFSLVRPREAGAVAYLSVLLMAMTSVLVALAAVGLGAWLRTVLGGPLVARRHTDIGTAVAAVVVAGLVGPSAAVVAGSVTTWRSVQAVEQAAAYVERHVPRGGEVVVGFAVAHAGDSTAFDNYADSAGLLWALRAAGRRPMLPGPLALVFGPVYEARTVTATVASVRYDAITGSMLDVTLRDPRSRSP